MEEKTYVITDRKGTRFLADIEDMTTWDSASASYVPKTKIIWAAGPKNARTFTKEQLDKMLLCLVGKPIAFREAVLYTYYSVWWYGGEVSEVKIPTSTCPSGYFESKAEAAAAVIGRLTEHIKSDEALLNERKAALENLRKIIAEDGSQKEGE